MRFKLDPADGSFTLRSRDRLSTDPWRLHAAGRLWTSSAESSAQRLAPPLAAPQLDAQTHYAMAQAVGLDYGPAVRKVEAVWRDGDAVVASLESPGALVGEARELGLGGRARCALVLER